MEQKKKKKGRSSQPCTNLECQQIRYRLEEELRRLKSVSYDMVKQTGDWQCGGRTHEDYGEAFDSFFLENVEELAILLQSSTELERAEAKQLLCKLFQAIYERCQDRVLDRMRTSLSNVVRVSSNSKRTVAESEALHDSCRAYGLLLHASQVRDIPEHTEVSSQVHCELLSAQSKLSAIEQELQKFTAEAAAVSWDLLTTVPPLVVSQPSRFSRHYHQTENWDQERGDRELTYLRPVLFSSYEGRVAKKGWVTNRAMGQCDKFAGLLSRETGPGQKSDVSKKWPQARDRDTDKYSHFVDLGREPQLWETPNSTPDGQEEEEGDRETAAEEGGIGSELPLLRLMNK